MHACDLCLELMKLDNENDVIETLRAEGYWDKANCWRDFGDNENNFSTAGAQQSDATAAFVEKLINSIDARLMNAVQMKDIDPKSANAPRSVQQAVAGFLIKGDKHGVIKNWTQTEKEEHAAMIAVAATGSKNSPSFTIVDQGEGQTPSNIPYTFMSLNSSNKLKIPFVQGKFNMGGTGVFRFCGERSIQLLVTRRNPKFVDMSIDDDSKWGFTVVRRDPPSGSERSSVFRYLAPYDEGKEKKGVLRFSADKLPLFPEQGVPYARNTGYGSLIKLYNYKVRQKSHILVRNGLRNAIDIRIPAPALPIRFHECRSFQRSGPSEILVGILLKLEDRQEEQLEDGFPIHTGLTVEGQEFNLSTYGFKQKQAESYFTAGDGVLFSVNGQTHGKLARRFFRTKRVRLDYVANSMLVHVDCSNIDPKHQEELFMNSRDRLADSPFRRELERQIEEYLGSDEKLRKFAETRREELLKEKVKDDKSFSEIMKQIMESSPSLAKILARGGRLDDDTEPPNVGKGRKFERRQFPTYFRFRKKDYGTVHHRQCEIGRTTKIAFDTDAENNYFFRKNAAGESRLVCVLKATGETKAIDYHRLGLADGVATLKIRLPEDVEAGETVQVRLEVTDVTQTEPFINVAELDVIPRQERPSGPPSPPSDRRNFLNVDVPETYWVKESEWSGNPQTAHFDKQTAVAITARSNDQGRQLYDFFLNEDNIYLKNELRKSDKTADLIKEQYRIGMVLVGLGLIQSSPEDQHGEDLEQSVAETTKALAPMIIPIIRDISSIEVGDISNEDVSTDDEEDFGE